MKFQMISKKADGVALLGKLQDEGHGVGISVLDNRYKDTWKGMIPHSAGIASDTDIVLFDMVGEGKRAQMLSNKFTIFGASPTADKIELDRVAGLQLMEDIGIQVPEYYEFDSVNPAIKFVEKRKKPYVIKPFSNKFFTIINKTPKDTIVALETSKIQGKFMLQRYMTGHEISTEGWFINGEYMDGSANHTAEAKKFMNNDLGPPVGCASSMVWKTKPHDWMKKIGEHIEDYNGPIDINFIVRDGKWYGLEFTPRFGYNAIYCLIELLDTPFADVFALGSMNLRDGYSYGIRVSIPPYPVELLQQDEHLLYNINKLNSGIPLFIPQGQESHVWLLDIMKNSDELVCAGIDSVVCEVTSSGKTPQEAAKNTYRIANGLRLKNKQYRTDGERKAIQTIQTLFS